MKRRKFDHSQRLIPERSHLSNRSKENLPLLRSEHKSSDVQIMQDMDTMSSDAFKLQINELLADTQPQDLELLETAQSLVKRIRAAIERLPSRGPLPLVQAESVLREKSKICVPFPEPRPTVEAKYSLEFAPPAKIQLADSIFKGSTFDEDGSTTLQMILMMPSHIFQDKDHINHRYFHKRAYYLACVASGILQTLTDLISIEFDLHQGNWLLPSLLVSQLGDTNVALKSTSCRVRIVTAIHPQLFPLAKTMPMKNCVRVPAAANGGQAHPPTPFYNSTLRSEASTVVCMDLLDETMRNVAGFVGAVRLMAIWLRQRGFDSNIYAGGFGVFEISILVALLLQRGGMKGRPIFPASYSHHQLFRATIYFLATRDLCRSPLFLDTDQTLDVGVYGNFMPVFFDGAFGFNVLFKMTAWSYAKLQQEASSTLACLGDLSLDRLRCCFIAKLNTPFLQYDYILRGRLNRVGHKDGVVIDRRSPVLDACIKIYTILQRGLNDRVRLIYLDILSPKPWSLEKGQAESETVFKIYLIASPIEMERKIDRGPPAETDEAAEEFRNFWGQRAELRRFKDGSIVESVTWPQDSSTTSIVCGIINHLLSRHLGDQLREPMHAVSDGLEQRLPANKSSQLSSEATGVCKAFEMLKQSINESDGVPLQIRQLSPASAPLRLTSTSENDGDTHMSVTADVVLQFESSGRWPDDFTAIQKTKVALLLKLGEILEQDHSALVAMLGVENQDDQLLNAAFLDISLAGYQFRLRIHHDREQTLLERQLTSESSLPSEKQAAATAIPSYKSTFTNAPLFAEVVRSLCVRYRFLSPTIRLLKVWCSRHLLTAHVNEELLELIAISAFTQPLPYREPGSLRTGFLRAISRIAQWNWRHEPLLVHMNNTLSTAEMDAIQMQLDAWRKIDPAMTRTVLFVGTPLDQTGIAWTRNCPQKVIATRLVALAKATLASATSDPDVFDAAPLFNTPRGDYDFLIHVKRGLASRHARKTGASANGNVFGRRNDPSSDSNVIKAFVTELESIFSESVLLLYDGLGPDFIAGLWNPAAGPRKWKVNIPFSTVLQERHSNNVTRHVTINKASILHDIARLGRDLVSRIEILSDI